MGNKNPDLNKISIDSGNPLLAGLSKYIVKEEDYVETLDDNMDIQQDASLAQPKQAENSDFATKAKIQFSTNDEYKAALDPRRALSIRHQRVPVEFLVTNSTLPHTPQRTHP